MLRIEATALGSIALAVLVCTASPAAGEETALERMEKAVVNLADRVAPSVVAIEFPGRKAVSLRRRLQNPPKKQDEKKYREFLSKFETDIRRIEAWGSAFAVDPEHVVTTTRVIPETVKTIRVLLPDGSTRKGTVVGRLRRYNTVLLSVEGGGLKPLSFASKPARVGQYVMSVGNPFEAIHRMWRPAVSLGVVSGRYKPKEGFLTFYRGEVIETDAAVNPGSYGGPLVNRKGEVVGMVTSSFDYRRWLGCAIPADTVRRALDEIRGATGETVEGDAFEVPTLGATLTEKGGAWVVAAVLDGGPARALGWRPQDRIIAVNGTPPRGGRSGALETFSAGRTLKVRIWRDGWEKVFEVDIEAETEGDEF